MKPFSTNGWIFWVASYTLLGVLATLWLTVGLAFSPKVIVGHVWVLSAVLSGVSIVCFLLRKIPLKWRTATFRLILGWLSITYVFTLFFFLLAQMLWGRSMSYAVAWEALGDLESWSILVDLYGFPNALVWVIGMVGLLAWLFFFNEKLIAEFLKDSFPFRRAMHLGMFLIISAGIILIWPAASLNLTYRNGEPITHMLKPRNSPPEPFLPNAFSQGVKETRLRKELDFPSGFDRKHVVLIIMDALRADHLGVYGYERPTTPFLSEWVSNGQLQKVEKVFSTCSHSICGVASIMSSRIWSEMGISNTRLYEMLHRAGYATFFFLSGNHTPIFLLDHSQSPYIDYYFDGSNDPQFPRYNDQRILTAFDQKQVDLSHPTFFYFHFMSTHTAGLLDTAFHRYQPIQSMGDWEQSSRPSYIIPKITNTYDNRVLQADNYLKNLLDILEGKGILSNCLLFIIGDHGEALGEHGHFGHRYHLNNEDINIPLLIYDSDSVSYSHVNYSTQVDVAPTILDRLGLPIPENWEGQSLLGREEKTYSFHQTDPFKSLAVIHRKGTILYKYLVKKKDSHFNESLFDLTHDSAETQNVSEDHPALLEELRKAAEEKWNIEINPVN